MGEYDRTGNGQNGEADWDLRSILCDMAKNWWIILLIACSAAMITYTVLTAVHRDQYTVKTTFAVMGRGENANAASSLSSTYEMTQKFQAILENNILKKKVMEELGCSSFPADMSASIVPESNLMELSVTADSPETAFRVLRSVLKNYTTISDYIIPNVVLETLQQPQVSGSPSNRIPTEKYAAMAFLAAALGTAALVGFFSFLRDTVKNETEFGRKIDADLLGTVYHEKKRKNSSMLITNPARSFPYVESLKRIASRVRGRLDRRGGKVLLVTSVAENEGKSTLAANLALALSEEQNRVLLLDCDFRQPALYKIFELPHGSIRPRTMYMPHRPADTAALLSERSRLLQGLQVPAHQRKISGTPGNTPPERRSDLFSLVPLRNRFHTFLCSCSFAPSHRSALL